MRVRHDDAFISVRGKAAVDLAVEYINVTDHFARRLVIVSWNKVLIGIRVRNEPFDIALSRPYSESWLWARRDSTWLIVCTEFPRRKTSQKKQNLTGNVFRAESDEGKNSATAHSKRN